MAASTNKDYDAVLQRLQSIPPPLLPPGHSYDAELTGQIAALQVHPALEAVLHVLNHDLPSAHFLVRKMESPPAIEGMHTHAILHRIEGDYPNSEAWYGDIAKDNEGAKLLDKCWKAAWEDSGKIGIDSANDFVSQVKELKTTGKGTPKEQLEKISIGEITALREWCEEKFGIDKMEDASSAWVKSSEKLKKQGQDMVTGMEGFRKF